MERKKLSGGKVLGVVQGGLPMPMYADPPKWRVGAPGTIIGNVASFVLINECSKQRYGRVEPTKAKVVFRDIDGELFLVVIPVWDDGPDIYELRFEQRGQRTRTVGLKRLFKDSEVTLRRDQWYDLSAELADDDTLGVVVVASWMNAEISARPITVRKAAAGQ